MKTLFSLLLAFTVVAGANAQTSTGPTLTISRDNRTITVAASDHAEAEPEIADVHIGFTVYGSTLQAAYKAGSDSSNTIMTALLGAGARRTDVQSGAQSVSRLSDYEIKQQKGARYRVAQSWTVSVAPKDAAGVLDAAIGAGANSSGDINWRMKDSVKLDAEAIRRATERAHAIAEQLAASLGGKLGPAIYATNTLSSGIMSLPLNGRMANFAQLSAGVVAEQVTPLAIQPQHVDRTADVQIIYALE